MYKTEKPLVGYHGLDKTENFEKFKSKYLNISEKDIENASRSSTIESKMVKKTIDSGEVSKKININNQNRYIKDSNGYIEGRNYITGNIEYSQNLLMN